jgi:hypothetical protein
METTTHQANEALEEEPHEPVDELGFIDDVDSFMLRQIGK